MARPATARARIHKNELEKLMGFYPSEQEAADWFEVSISSLRRYIKVQFKCSFEQLRAKKFVRTKIAIKRAQIDKALKGDNSMLIWLGKQYLGQSDNVEPAEDEKEQYERPASMRSDD